MSLSGLGKGLFGRIGIGDYRDLDVYSDSGPLVANSPVDLAKKLKYGKNREITYSRNGYTFVIGKDPIHAGISDDEAESILMAVETYAPVDLLKRFYDAQLKSDVVALDVPRGKYAQDVAYGMALREKASKEINGLRDVLRAPRTLKVKIDGQEVDWSDVLEYNGITRDPKGVLRLDGEKVAYVGNNTAFVAPENMEYFSEVLRRISEISKDPSVEMSPELERLLGHYLKKIPVVVDRSSEALDAIKLRVLGTLPYVNACDSRWLGAARASPNSHTEQLRGYISGYSGSDVSRVLNQLEEDGVPKRKISALREMLKDRAGTSKRGGLLAVIAASAAILGIYGAYMHFKQNNGGPNTPEDPSNSTNVDPIDPTNSTDPVIPVDPTNSTDPVIPVDPTNSTDPVDPVDPGNSTDPEFRPFEKELYDNSPLFGQLDNATIDLVLQVAAKNGSTPITRNLALLALNQIYKDGRVTDKAGLAKEVFKLYLNYTSQVQKLSQMYHLNNATYHFKTTDELNSEISAATLSSMLGILANNGVDSNFDNTREHASLLRLLQYNPAIKDWPGDWRNAALQIGSLLYGRGFDNVKGERYMFEEFVRHAIDFYMGQKNKGIITAPDGKINLIFADQLQMDVETGEFRFITGSSLSECLDVGIGNFKPDSTGTSKFQRVFDLLHGLYNENEKIIEWGGQLFTPREVALIKAQKIGEGIANNWPNCNVQFQSNLDKIIQMYGDLPVLIWGSPYLLRGDFLPNPIVMTGQYIPNYTNNVASMFGINSTTVSVLYPNSTTVAHDEPGFMLDGELVSFWGWGKDFAALLKDDSNAVLRVHGTDGLPVEVDLGK